MINNKDFSETMADPNPFVQFKIWYTQHLASGVLIPDSVCLATSTKEGNVSVRMVLMKDYNDKGFIFFTNYKSRKGAQLLSNPQAALLFYWPGSGRQIRIEGKTEKVSEKISESYFAKRPRESQLSAWASEQSSVIPDRQYLENRYNTYKNIYSEKPVDKPSFWGGFRLIPEWFEFWEEGEYRLHNRLTYSKTNNLWVIRRLAP